MKRIREALERSFAGAAFAEAGAHDEALAMAGITPLVGCATSVEDMFAAVAFAEAGCREEALEVLGCVRPVRRVIHSDFLNSVGLGEVPVWYGLAPAMTN